MLKMPIDRSFPQAFTLIELLVVIAIIGILVTLLLPSLSRTKQSSGAIVCKSQLHQVGIGMELYANDNNDLYPESGNQIFWGAIDSHTKLHSWMELAIPYTVNTNVYKCPNDKESNFSYFNGARAAYVDSGSVAPVNRKRVLFSTAFVLSGDTIWGGKANAEDADKDDFTANCVGGPLNGVPALGWRRHNGSQNLLFVDGHVKAYETYVPAEMTFRYDSIHSWR